MTRKFGTAAPTYFEAANIKSILGVSYPLIDGGVFANNPAMCAYAEARKCKFGEVEHSSSKEMLMLSMGAGSVNEKIPYSSARNFGLVQWIRPLISVMMSGNSETVSHQLVWLYDAGKNSEGYIRIEPDLHNANPDLDDASNENLNALKEAGLHYIQKNEEKIYGIVSKLIDNRS